jgi:hypothetical protein
MASEPKLAIRKHKRAYLVYGTDTEAHKAVLKSLGLRWNPTLRGWIFGQSDKTKLEEVTKLIESVGGNPNINSDISEEDVVHTDSIELGAEMINVKGAKIKVMMMEKNDGKVSFFIGSDGKKYLNTKFGWLNLEDINEIAMKPIESN